ncbi:hypothetical protein LAZ67_2006273 [Cordylochernes scorpioides]|uniref:Mos1 transposase HTH domain-containing protein n=1 Tax=Cordylochernes scorpioides TaxID=51811 RepID=A0ABY6K8F6_9ARAC|nr:hypothetical protein LAZ67_2006273 [Cordylochernes scorpioides]
MIEAYEDEKLSRTPVYFWYKRFKYGRKSIADDSRSGRPLTSTTDRNIGQNQNVTEATTLSINETTTQSIVSYWINTNEKTEDTVNFIIKKMTPIVIRSQGDFEVSGHCQAGLVKFVLGLRRNKNWAYRTALLADVLDRLRFLPIKKMDQRTCIKFCVKNEIKCADAFRMLTVAYGEATLDRSNVYRWYKMFSEGREDVNDEERAGRPSTSTTDEKINEVEKMILANRRITHRMNIANEMLDSVRDDPNLLQRVITGDEAWVYGYDVETKAQSSQWKLPHEPRPKKARQVRSNVKVLLTVFFDCRGVVHHEFLAQGRTVNKEYYLQVMRNLREAIRQKRPDLWKNKNWLLHHDNAPAHTSLLVRDFLAKKNTLMMPQPPYSTDLAPCDFFLFLKLKRPMKGRRYATLDEIKTASKKELKKIF